jgi:SPP1 family predicted phage head-tail adaptor
MQTEVKIGQLDRRILFQNQTITKQSNGEELSSWTSHAYRWAKAEQYSSSEINESGMLTVYSKAFFTVRYDAALNEKMRVYYDGKIYNIIGIEEIGRREYQKIDCESKQIANGIFIDSTEITVDSTLILSDQEWQ